MLGNELPLLPLRDIVIYPFMIVPLFVSREKSIRAVDEALGQNRMILLTCQKDLDKEEPQQEDLYNVGTVAVIMRMLKLPDGRIRILVQGVSRASVESINATAEYLHAKLKVMTEVLAPERSLEDLCKAMLDRLTDQAHIIETGTESYRFRRTLAKKGRKA